MKSVKHNNDLFTFYWPWRVREDKWGDGFRAWVPWWARPIHKLLILFGVKSVKWERITRAGE